jgi:hypothetical protein
MNGRRIERARNGLTKGQLTGRAASGEIVCSIHERMRVA